MVIIIKMNPFTVQGKAIPSSVREKVVESWLEGKGPTQIGNSEAEKGGNNTRLAHTDDVNVFFLSTVKN